MDPESGRIESWKAIADYIRCDVTTAMRWERERGLPIYRLQGDKRSGVYSFRRELDAWLEAGRRRRASEVPTGVVRGADTTEMSERPPAPGLGAASPDPSRMPTHPRPKQRPIGLAVVAIVVILGLLGGATRWGNGRPRVISLRVEGATLVALDASNRPVWTKAFKGSFLESSASGQELVNRSWIGDLRGDGGTDVLFLARQPAGEGVVEDTLYCFNSSGAELWSFRLQDTFTFRNGTFGPPWHQGVVTVYEVHGQKRIALALAHQVWWPGSILTLNPRGERLSTFVSSGLIYQIRSTTRDGRPLILAAGTSNSREAGSLIVLDGENPLGTTPEEPGSPFECLSCPAGRPLHYFSFPKTELAVAAKRPYNHANSIRASDRDVLVGVLEVADLDGGRRNAASTFFRFDESFRLTDARWSDGFGPVHKVYEEAGALNHSASSCPNLVPRVRAHEPGHGLVDLRLPGDGRASASSGDSGRR